VGAATASDRATTPSFRPDTSNPFAHIAADLRIERAADAPLPPGELRFSIGRTLRFNEDPLTALLEAYERFGPVFTLRLLHAPVVFMLGPAANHHITVAHADNFLWRDGSLGDLIALLGDGLLTTDGAAHKRARRILLPAFHRERIAASATTMLDEAERAVAPWHDGEEVEAYLWARRLALRVATRALFGLDPDDVGDVDLAAEFEDALALYGRNYFAQSLRGPGSPWRRLQVARRRLDRVLFTEIARRRRRGEEREDILSLLLAATDEDGWQLTDQQVRDQAMTLLFAGHDTTTSTVAFLLYELARNPHEVPPLLDELDALGGRRPTAAELMGGLPRLEMAMDETLRMYPPAWIGPRRAIDAFSFEGHEVPAGARVNYCSWASHHLAEVFPDPFAFRPARFAPDAKAKLPKGAYVPFGGGSRTCIGMRFGQLEIKAIAATVLQRATLDLQPDFGLRIREMPTLSPRDGLPMTVRSR
jgi:cytochrome P450